IGTAKARPLLSEDSGGEAKERSEDGTGVHWGGAMRQPERSQRAAARNAPESTKTAVLHSPQEPADYLARHPISSCCSRGSRKKRAPSRLYGTFTIRA